MTVSLREGARTRIAHQGGLSVILGANVFGGEAQTTFFGRLDKNDNLFLNVRFDF